MSRWIETELKLLLPGASAYDRVRAAIGDAIEVSQKNHFFDRPDGALRAARIGVRLRRECESAESGPVGAYVETAAAPGVVRTLTLKGDGGFVRDGALAHRFELECEIDDATFSHALADGLELAPFLARFRAESTGSEEEGHAPAALARFLDRLEALCRDVTLVCRAGFSNRRALRSVSLPDPAGALEVELALDRTSLPGGRIDYEIEVELDAPSPEEARRSEGALRRWLRALGIDELTPAPSKLARLHDVLDRAAAAESASSAPQR